MILLVITSHAVHAYFAYAALLGAFDGYIVWGVFPVIDTVCGPGLDVLVQWSDSFFMALLFPVSGLLVGPSPARKGTRRFLRDRFIRLGVHFVAAALVIAPLAYYPAWLQRTEATNASGSRDAWLALGTWPAGPAWYLWVLLAFTLIATLVSSLIPALPDLLAWSGAWCRSRPIRTAMVLMVAALAAYVPVVQSIDPSQWTA